LLLLGYQILKQFVTCRFEVFRFEGNLMTTNVQEEFPFCVPVPVF